MYNNFNNNMATKDNKKKPTIEKKTNNTKNKSTKNTAVKKATSAKSSANKKTASNKSSSVKKQTATKKTTTKSGLIKIPIVLTIDMINFPGFNTEIDIGRSTSLKSVRISEEKYNNQILILSQSKDVTNPSKNDIFDIGTLSKITNVQSYDDGSLTLSLTGMERFKVTSIELTTENYYIATGKIVKNLYGDQRVEKQLLLETSALIRSKLNGTAWSAISDKLKDLLDNGDASRIVDGIGNNFDILTTKQKYLLIKTLDVNERISALNQILESEIKIDTIEDKINSKIKSKLNTQQREFYLREKLKAIKDELNEINGVVNDADGIEDKLSENPYPKNIKNKIMGELKRFEQSPQGSAEANVIKNYIDTVMELPYWQKTSEVIDIDRTKKILDKNHYGLEKVKERIIEYLAVKQVNPSAKGPIICLVGPPGIGKTSLVISIAEALEKKFQKISLGGVRDEAEIRGHRKTYIGAMPGKIIQSMKKAKVINPLLLLDEIDKMSSDFRGDPTSAMLEVLDYEQNSHFQDHYIEEDYDLSKVMFLATANYYDDIPAPLLDRLEIINLSSYTESEKVQIASTHLIPRVVKETGVDAKKFKISKKALSFLIRGYTRESGVRELQRKLNTLARKIIVNEIEKGKTYSIKLDEEGIESLLKKPIFLDDRKEKKPQIGAVTALAWTPYGGSAFPIEVTMFPGKGNLILTGMLKEVMQESANIALNYIKSNALEWGVDLSKIKENDIHIHVPEGAVPKDGPSAGVTFTTALLSAFTNTPISQKVAMTGEITLRGHVLPIGGLKEKSLAAERKGIKTIFIPSENAKDIEGLADEVKKNIKIVPVEDYIQIYDELFDKNKKKMESLKNIKDKPSQTSANV